jgi:hypothetical protein
MGSVWGSISGHLDGLVFGLASGSLHFDGLIFVFVILVAATLADLNFH